MRDVIGLTCQASHPHIGNNGEAYGLGQVVGVSGPNYAIIRYPSPNEASSTASKGKKLSSVKRGQIVSRVPCRSMKEPSYMHSFSITESYYVLVEQPLVVPLKAVLKYMVCGKPLVNALKWRDIAVSFYQLFFFSRAYMFNLIDGISFETKNLTNVLTDSLSDCVPPHWRRVSDIL